jgi:hypothetical protein
MTRDKACTVFLLLEGNGHMVLRLPPYGCETQDPIKLVLAKIKHYAKEQIVLGDFHLAELGS